MATYEITSPDGQKYRVTAPDDATQDQVMAYAQKNFKLSKAPEQPKYDPTEGMSTFEKAAAGLGKSIYDTARGVGQLTGLVSRTDVDEARKRDKALMQTGAGQTGEIVGNLAQALPLAFIPGANTLKGAALIGSAAGLAQPSASTSETLQNIGLGGAASAGGTLLGRGLAAGYQGVSGLVRPLTAKGQEQIASEVFQQSATDAAKAAQNMRAAKELVPGSAPTAGQSANDAGIAQLERTLLNKPESAGALNRRYAEQLAARKQAISGVAGTPEARAAAEEGRAIFAAEDYANAMKQGIDPKTWQKYSPEFDRLMQRPSMQQAQDVAKKLAAEQDVAIDGVNAVQGLDWIKKALDNQISAAQKPGSSIGKEQLNSLTRTKSDLIGLIEKLSPTYKEANDNFAKMSRQINAQDVAADLQKRLYKNAEWGAGKEMGSTYQGALSDAIESIKKQTGQNRELRDVMPMADIARLEGVALDLARKENAQNLGRAVGSPTMQNMMGQNLVNRIAGPLGVPQSFGQSVLASAVARPYDFVMKSAQPKIEGLLSEIAADPIKAAAALEFARQPSTIGLLANRAERFLPVPGLLAIENR